MLKTRCITTISAVAAVLMLGTSGASFAAKGEMKDINSYTCKDVMRMSGEDRDISISYLHGYWLGKSGKTKFSKKHVMAATDSFVDYCLDNPAHKAADAMGKFVK